MSTPKPIRPLPYEPDPLIEILEEIRRKVYLAFAIIPLKFNNELAEQEYITKLEIP